MSDMGKCSQFTHRKQVQMLGTAAVVTLPCCDEEPVEVVIMCRDARALKVAWERLSLGSLDLDRACDVRLQPD